MPKDDTKSEVLGSEVLGTLLIVENENVVLGWSDEDDVEIYPPDTPDLSSSYFKMCKLC